MKYNIISLRSVVIFVVMIYSTVVGQFNSEGCADPSGLDECTTQVSAQFDLCAQSSDSTATNDGIILCGCAQNIGDMNCYATHCWNRVYECEYQNYIASYFELCPTAQFPVPYSPPPNGTVPDSCSCNIGEILSGITTSIQHGQACSPQNETGLVEDLIEIHADDQCGCCVYSGAISRYVPIISVYNFCPTTDPKLTGLMIVSEFANQLPFNVCAPFLSQTDCSSVLNLDPAAVGGTFFNPNNLPVTTGTATLSNLPGTVTAPASGSVFTYTNGGDGAVYTIRAANGPQHGPSGIGKINAAGTNSPRKGFQAIMTVVAVMLVFI